MNLLREEFCKETNTPMGLDDVYNYVKWLENKLQQERSYSEEEVLELLLTYKIEKHEDIKEWFEKFKNK